MRLRILAQPTGTIDGVALDQFRLGGIYELGTQVACVFLAERWAEAVGDDEPPAVVRPPPPAVARSEPLLLLVDDDPAMRRMTETLLTADGYRVIVAVHGRDAIQRLRGLGLTVILSDGDVVFQPRKVERSGLWAAVEGRVLIYIHKEQMLDDVRQRYPARHYVMVDDKLRILAAMKKTWNDQLTTVFPRQGHYALDPKIVAAYPPADVAIERIGDLVNYDLPVLMGQKEER